MTSIICSGIEQIFVSCIIGTVAGLVLITSACLCVIKNKCC